jgi:heme exporter protein B
MPDSSPLLALLRRDALLLWRNLSSLLQPLVFMALVASLFPLALGPDSTRLASLAPGLIWVMVLLAALLSMDALFRTDAEDGSLDQWRCNGLGLLPLVWAKILLHWFSTALPLILLAPLIALAFGMPGNESRLLLCTLLLGTPQISVYGALAAALTAGLRQTGLLLSLVVLPLLVPVLIFGAGAVNAARYQGDAVQPLALLAAGLVFALSFAPFVAAFALKQAARY